MRVCEPPARAGDASPDEHTLRRHYRGLRRRTSFGGNDPLKRPTTPSGSYREAAGMYREEVA